MALAARLQFQNLPSMMKLLQSAPSPSPAHGHPHGHPYAHAERQLVLTARVQQPDSHLAVASMSTGTYWQPAPTPVH